MAFGIAPFKWVGGGGYFGGAFLDLDLRGKRQRHGIRFLLT